MAHPNHNYDSKEFYTLLEKYASVCQYDKDVATLLDLEDTTFSRMKRGIYEGWNEEQNKRRGERISQVLLRARANAVMLVKNNIFRLGIGKATVKSRSVKANAIHCDCKGKDPMCPKCWGSGWIKDEENGVVIQETEQQVAPNLAAMQLWLRHHDPNYRKVERGEEPDGQGTLDPKQGVDMMSWLKREMEEQSIMANNETVTADAPNML